MGWLLYTWLLCFETMLYCLALWIIQEARIMLLRTSLKPATPEWIVAFRHGSVKVQTVRAISLLMAGWSISCDEACSSVGGALDGLPNAEC